MLSHSNFLSLNHLRTSHRSSPPAIHRFLFSARNRLSSVLNYGAIQFNSTYVRSSLSNDDSCSDQALAARLDNYDLDLFAEAGNKLADAAGDVIRKYFRKSFDILDKEDSNGWLEKDLRRACGYSFLATPYELQLGERPVTIADRAAEESMVKIIQEHFPSHAIYGEENGWMCKEDFADFVWVLDPIDGTKSFITGRPLFGTLIALLHKGKPILGIIDQPILRERWIGIIGRRTALNGQEISVQLFTDLESLPYTTSPHLFSGGAEVAFARVRSKVKAPLYGCDCYAYALLASGYVDLVIESGLKPYDFLSLIPVIEGAGGVITDWKGHQLHWEASSKAHATSFNVVAAGDEEVHREAIETLLWQ
ncbi:Bifunctional phosphatase IMPL2, chloroplastic [Orobanche gracilis]